VLIGGVSWLARAMAVCRKASGGGELASGDGLQGGGELAGINALFRKHAHCALRGLPGAPGRGARGGGTKQAGVPLHRL
jgi:hypothetical protein